MLKSNLTLYIIISVVYAACRMNNRTLDVE